MPCKSFFRDPFHTRHLKRRRYLFWDKYPRHLFKNTQVQRKIFFCAWGTTSLSMSAQRSRLGIWVPRLQGRVGYGKLTLRPSDWSARTPLTRLVSLIGPRGTPSLGPRLLCVPGLRAVVLRLPSRSGLVRARSSAHCSASRAPGISRVRAGRKHPREPLSRTPKFFFPYRINFRLKGAVAAPGRGRG